MSIWDFISRRKKLDFDSHISTDEHGCEWVDTKFFGFGDLSPAKDATGLIFPTAKEYLEQYGSEYPWKQMWLNQGKTFASPSRELCLRINQAEAHVRGNCYNNAIRLAIGMGGKIILPNKPNEVLYCEGMAVNPTGAYLHAWLVVDGNVYDPTWPDAYRATYFGITFDPQWILNFAETVGKVSLLQNWEYAEPRLSPLFEPA